MGDRGDYDVSETFQKLSRLIKIWQEQEPQRLCSLLVLGIKGSLLFLITAARLSLDGALFTDMDSLGVATSLKKMTPPSCSTNRSSPSLELLEDPGGGSGSSIVTASPNGANPTHSLLDSLPSLGDTFRCWVEKDPSFEAPPNRFPSLGRSQEAAELPHTLCLKPGALNGTSSGVFLKRPPTAGNACVRHLVGGYLAREAEETVDCSTPACLSRAPELWVGPVLELALVDQVVLKLTEIRLPLPPECWD
ncbi:hypothetical protein U0070_020937 [Myodes glareolus]|uniref:Uncharacterized protein n=1 Tax=Myodes glareolus TaxID=447135 RepID=A0AAW0IIY9_MYOGA